MPFSFLVGLAIPYHLHPSCRVVQVTVGGNVMHWKVLEYPLVRPEVIDHRDTAVVRAPFGALQGAIMARLRIGQCLRLHRPAP